VVSSGAIKPARAPASMDMLHTVILPAMSRASMASPVYSITWPVASAVPMLPIMDRMRSLAVVPTGITPLTLTSMFFAGF
jgi:hypothetical protein